MREESSINGQHLVLSTRKEGRLLILCGMKLRLKKIQSSLWQLNAGGLLVGSWSICMGYENYCQKLQIQHHLKLQYFASWIVRHLEKFEDFLERLDMVLIRKRASLGKRLWLGSLMWLDKFICTRLTTSLLYAWDMLRGAIIWQIQVGLKNESMAAESLAATLGVIPSTREWHIGVKSWIMVSLEVHKLKSPWGYIF